MSDESPRPDVLREGGLNQLLPCHAPVSVVIPCYCCSETIGRALASIAAQTVLPHEVILVEDASPDGGKTLDVLRHFAGEYADTFGVKITVLKENSGAGSARNRGWEAAGQPYIAFLDADDAWHPQKIEIQYGWMSEHPEYGLAGHAHARQQKQDRSWPCIDPDIEIWRVSKSRALFSNPFSTPTVMLKRDLPYRFREGKRYTEDYLLWLEIILSGTPTAYINQPMASTYKADYGAGGLSAHLWEMEKGELGTYWAVYRTGRIGIISASLFSMYSLVKYLRRIFYVSVAMAKRASSALI